MFLVSRCPAIFQSMRENENLSEFDEKRSFPAGAGVRVREAEGGARSTGERESGERRSRGNGSEATCG